MGQGCNMVNTPLTRPFLTEILRPTKSVILGSLERVLIIRRMVVGFLARLGVRGDPAFGPLGVKRSAAVH